MANFPVFTPDPRWFPMPTLQQGSPFGGVLSDAIAKRLAMANAQKAESQAKYSDRGELAKVLYNEMVNQYYPQDIQSQIGLRNQQAALAGQHAKYYPQDISSQIGLRNAQAGLHGQQASKIGYELSHPELFYGGNDSKEIAGLELLKSKGMLPGNTGGQGAPPQQIPSQAVSPPRQANSAPYNTGNTLYDSILNRKFAQPAYQNLMTQGFNWIHLPVDTKNQLLAQGAGMGIDPLKMVDYVNKGMGLQEIAQAEGLDPNNLPPPIYPPTERTKSNVQQVVQVGNELDYLSSATTPLISQYADTFAGYSPSRISDMLSNDPEAQKRFGRYMGALSVQTGIANGRVLLEGGKSGLEVMRMVKDSAMKGIDQVVKPIKNTKIAYEEAQRTIDELLHKGAKIRTTTGMNPFSEIGKAHAEEPKSEGSGKDTYSTWKMENGKAVRVNK